MDMTVSRKNLEMAYVSNPARFARDVGAGRHLEDWLGYCMLPWPLRTLPFLDRSNVWQNASKFEQHYHTQSECPFFVTRHSRESFSCIAGREEAYVCCNSTVMEGVQTMPRPHGAFKHGVCVQFKQHA